MSDTPKERGMGRVKDFQRHYFPEIFSEPDPVPESIDETEQEPLLGFRRTELVQRGAVSARVMPARETLSRVKDTPLDMDPPDTAQHYAQGYDEGERAGIAAERGRLESIIKMLRLAMEEVEAVKADLNRAAERQALHLALAVARKVLQTEVQINPEAVARVVRGALEHSVEAENLTVKVNPGDLHILKNLEFRSPELSTVLEKCNFESDDQVSSGGCLIQSELGEIDARIATQLRFIEERFLAILEESNG